MSEELLQIAAKRIAEGLESALGVTLERSLGEMQAADAASLGEVLGGNPVATRAHLASGGVCILMDEAAGAKILALSQGAESDGGALDENLGPLTELWTGALSGIEGAADAEAVRLGAAGAEELAEYLGDDALIAPLSLSSGGELITTVYFAGGLAVLRELSPDGEPLVSEAEMNDILSGFGPEDEPENGNGRPLPENLDMIMGIELTATARLGRVRVPISEVLNYAPGSLIEVGHLVDEPVELLVNGKLIARGDVVVVDEKFGLRITEIVSPRERIESLR